MILKEDDDQVLLLNTKGNIFWNAHFVISIPGIFILELLKSETSIKPNI